MNFEQALMYFGTARNIAQALRVSPGRVSQCKAAGGFSYPMQCVLEKVSGGALQAFESDAPSANDLRDLIWPELAAVNNSPVPAALSSFPVHSVLEGYAPVGAIAQVGGVG